MLVWIGVFLLAFVAEALSDGLSVHYQTAVRKLWKRKAMLWGVCLGVLGWVDIAGLFAGLPMTAIIAGSLVGGAVGTGYAVHRMQIKARLKRKRKEIQA